MSESDAIELDCELDGLPWAPAGPGVLMICLPVWACIQQENIVGLKDLFRSLVML